MKDILLQDLTSQDGPLFGEKIISISSVSGGCIHEAWHIRTELGKQFFVKTNSSKAFSRLEFEADCLNALGEFADEHLLLIPKPLALKQFTSNSVLLLPWLNLINGDQSNLGEGLASLHKASNSQNPKKFGWAKDGFIGSEIQKGGWEADWGECFVNLRLLPQLKNASKWGLHSSTYEKLIVKIIPFLNEHNPQPSLVHGDLWSGNSGIQINGKGVMFDPASWWADREVDIAMTKLFGGFSDSFYQGYNKIWKIEKGSEKRRDVYNLYHIINHANIFGDSYIGQCLALIKKLSKTI